MVEVYGKDKCPKFIYKYCTSDVYHNYLQYGSYQLGTLAGYRHDYESKGAGYGDLKEGNPTILTRGPVTLGDISVGPEGGVLIDRYVNAYIFSAAYTYSKESHKRWFERKDCNYDLCLKIEAEGFFCEIAHKARFFVAGDLDFMLAKPIYNNGFSSLQLDKPKNGDLYLYKDKSLAWEDEYRLVCTSQKLGINTFTPVVIEACKATSFVTEVFRYQART